MKRSVEKSPHISFTVSCKWAIMDLLFMLDYYKGGYIVMKLILIIGVMVAFLSAIFTSGYEDKPGSGVEK